jgi:DNA polymerase elongation subunit (family B)
MLTQNIAPESDLLGVFLKALETLRTFRIEAKQAMQACQSGSEKQGLDALQSTFKILINSFYGYLGFDRGRFNDFDAADKVTSEGRSLLRSMVDALREYDANPIEIDTDGIYFVPPDFQGSAKDVTEQMATFRKNFSATLPAGIEVEFDGEYASMYSYKMKNYALLGADGKMSIKGAALKSRGLESFQRKFMHKMLRLKLEDQETDLPDLRQSFDDSIAKKQWPIEEFAKKENLQNSPANYAAKRANGQGSRRAAYELALASEREYKAGDQVSYYVTGIKKNVAVYASSKLTKDWDPNNRYENISYYQAKLEALYKKFGGPDRDSRQGELF